MKAKNFGVPGILAAAFVLAQLALAAGPVKVTGGQLQGAAGRDAAITVYKGIPYAAPPVGKLRWQAPQPVVGWEGVRKADQFGASCIQKLVYQRKPWTWEFMDHQDISENCLFVNVWTPAKAASEKLPVYLYIHGGGNVEGSGAVVSYDGEGLAKKGVVVVTLNYRLGILGTFTHPELTAESPNHASGNYSDLDIVAALKWIQQNIAQFGGDPAKVTIGGQSAGSGHVFTMTLTPLAKGLFRGAINESGVNVTALSGNAGTAQGGNTMVTLAESEKIGVAFAAAKGVKSLAELRLLSWMELIEPIPPAAPNAPAQVFRFGSVVDGYLIPATPKEIYSQGRQNDVPVLTGLNKHDNSGPGPNLKATVAEYQDQIGKRFGADAAEVLKLYPATSDAEAGRSLTEATWDVNRTGMWQWAILRAKTAKTPVFTYFWDHTLPGPDAALYGAFHTSEVPYVMNAIALSDRPFTDADRKIADTLSTYWANFIKTGNPNGAGLAHWPAAGEAPGMTMEIGDKYEPIPVVGDKAKAAFFERYYTAPR